jgi:hypothetical protein
MQVKTNVKAGVHFVAVVSKASPNHNEAQVRAAARGLKVQTGVKAGLNFVKICYDNHSEAQVRPAGLKVRTGVKAGGIVVTKTTDCSSTN